jgi:hypothetical protein
VEPADERVSSLLPAADDQMPLAVDHQIRSVHCAPWSTSVAAPPGDTMRVRDCWSLAMAFLWDAHGPDIASQMTGLDDRWS